MASLNIDDLKTGQLLLEGDIPFRFIGHNKKDKLVRIANENGAVNRDDTLFAINLNDGTYTIPPFNIGSKIVPIKNVVKKSAFYVAGIDYETSQIVISSNENIPFSNIKFFIDSINNGDNKVVDELVFNYDTILKDFGSDIITTLGKLRWWASEKDFGVSKYDSEGNSLGEFLQIDILRSINDQILILLPFKIGSYFTYYGNQKVQKLELVRDKIKVFDTPTTEIEISLLEFYKKWRDDIIKIKDDPTPASTSQNQNINAVATTQNAIDLTEFEIGHYFIIDDIFYRLRLVNADLYFFNSQQGSSEVLSLVGDEIIQKHKDNTLYHIPYTQGTIVSSGGSKYIIRGTDDDNLACYEFDTKNRLFVNKAQIKSSITNNTPLFDEVINNDLFHPRELYTLKEKDEQGNPIFLFRDKIFKITELFYNTHEKEWQFYGETTDYKLRTISEYEIIKQIWEGRRKTLARKGRLFTWGTYPQKNKFEIKYYNSEKLYVPIYTDVEFGVDLDGFFDSIKDGRIKWVDETQKSQSAAQPQKPVQSPKPPKKFAMSELDEKRKELNEWIEFKNVMDEVNPEEIVNINTNIYEKSKEIGRMLFEKAESELTDNAMLDELFEQSFKDLKRRYDDVYADEFTDFFAPDGKKSAYSDAINEITRTPQFKDWFGDWEEAYAVKGIINYDLKTSVVTTKDGEPQIVWHGTNNPFAYFKFDQFPAAYFAVNPEYSVWFAEAKDPQGGYVYPFFLNVRNPLDLTMFGIEPVSPTDFFATIFIETGLNKGELNMNPIFLDDNLEPVPIWVYLRNNPSFLQTLRDKNLYDGINFYEFIPNLPPTASNYKTEAWIIFSPENAKLADPERGKLMLSSLKSFILRRGGKI